MGGGILSSGTPTFPNLTYDYYRDKVAPIFHASLDLLSELLASFSSMLPKQQLHLGMDPIMPIIVHRCGNLNSRIHESSLQVSAWAINVILGKVY